MEGIRIRHLVRADGGQIRPLDCCKHCPIISGRGHYFGRAMQFSAVSLTALPAVLARMQGRLRGPFWRAQRHRRCTRFVAMACGLPGTQRPLPLFGGTILAMITSKPRCLLRGHARVEMDPAHHRTVRRRALTPFLPLPVGDRSVWVPRQPSAYASGRCPRVCIGWSRFVFIQVSRPIWCRRMGRRS